MNKITEIFTSIPFEILEQHEIEENGRKLMRVKGVFNRADEMNANKRIYPSRILEREHQRLGERIAKAETVFMQADHPADGVSRVADTAAILKSATFDPKTKLVTGEADILSTQKGKDLQEIIRANGKIGISARGFGTTTPGELAGQKGDVVNEDYQLVTYDFVVGQSTRGAVVSSFAEQARALAGLYEGDTQMDLKTLDLEALKAGRPDLIASITAEAKAAAQTEATKELAKLVAEKTAEIETKLRAELKLEKGKKAADEEDDDYVKEMLSIANRLGFTLEATSPGDSRYGGGKGRSGKGQEKSDSSDAPDQEDVDAHDPRENSGKGKKAEEQLVAWAAKHGLKLEKKKSKDEEDDVEERVETLRAQVNDLKKVNEQTAKQANAVQEQMRMNEVKAHIFEACKNEKKFKNALIERLLGAGLKTVAEVDARIPVETAAIEKLLVESGGGAPGKGETGKDEPVGRSEDGKYNVKTANGNKTLTEAELRQRELAGLSTELVEQSK